MLYYFIFVMMPIRAAKQRRSESRSRAAGEAMSGGAGAGERKQRRSESRSRAAGEAMSGGAGAGANVQFTHPLSRI